jgi:hypothetical protein
MGAQGSDENHFRTQPITENKKAMGGAHGLGLHPVSNAYGACRKTA